MFVKKKRTILGLINMNCHVYPVYNLNCLLKVNLLSKWEGKGWRGGGTCRGSSFLSIYFSVLCTVTHKLDGIAKSVTEPPCGSCSTMHNATNCPTPLYNNFETNHNIFKQFLMGLISCQLPRFNTLYIGWAIQSWKKQTPLTQRGPIFFSPTFNQICQVLSQIFLNMQIRYNLTNIIFIACK